ncbi:unnamed protein product [Calicophoron daubneyi]|uniref:Uncharacterized protein n=1 Tax=Calicophoron daubneyi TaxID=300641 RepID=A0AAV2TAG2_CALDB
MDTGKSNEQSFRPRDPSQPNSRRTSLAMSSRRVSYFNAGQRSSLLGQRGSMWGIFRGGLPKNVKYENTYRTEPKEKERINQKKLETLIQDILNKALDSEKYEYQKVQSLTTNLANSIRKSVRELLAPSRYKVVVNINIGSMKDTSLTLSSRALWHVESGDTFAQACFSNASLFAVALVFCTYYE